MSDGGNVVDGARGRKLGTVDAPPERSGGEVAPMPAMGTSVAVILAVAVIACGLFGFFLSRHEPRAGWLSLGAGVLALYLLPRYLPGLRERQALRNARKEARRLLKAVRQAMRQQKTWTGEGIQQKLDEACATLENALPHDDLASIEFASKKLDELADAHLARKAAAREYVEQIGGAVVAALILRAFFYEAFKIPSSSMVPTLLVGDHLFVNKFVYGLRIPFTLKKLFAQVPERGDIVVFNKPGDESGDDIIKRVIGLPGDRVLVQDRHVSICPGGTDCRPLETRLLEAVSLNRETGDRDRLAEEDPFAPFHQYEEKVGRHTHVMQAMDGNPQVPGYNEGSWTVEPGHVFVMGDNRDNSMDSRFGPPLGFGQVPIAYIKGRADLIWLSIGGPHGLRFSRMFSLLP